MFSDKVPIAGMIALGSLWVARWWVTGRLTAATPMDVPFLGILVMLPISLYASVDWSLSLPKIYGILLGVAIFYTVVNAIDTISRVKLVVFALILLSVAVALLGLVGADWAGSKLFSLPKVYENIPHLIKGVPRSITGGGIQSNIVGGAMAFFVPVLTNLLWDSGEFTKIRFLTYERLAGILRVAYRPVLIFSLVLTFLTLILTQSRGSYLGVMVGLLALAVWHDRRFLWLIPLIILGVFVLVHARGGGNLIEFVSRMDIAGESTSQGRMELWQRAIYMIQDFPFTGIGIGTFNPVAHVLYPFFLFSPDVEIPHAHNMLLEVAVDLGIPGLVLYVALLSGFTFSVWRAYRAINNRLLRALIVGLACGMLAHQVFGIMDAYMLGTKLGAVMWVFMGLVAALYVHQEQLAGQLLENVAGNDSGGNHVPDSLEQGTKVGSGQSRRRSGNFWLAIGYYLLFSLLAIAFTGDRIYLGLAIALAGGIILGFICL
jgi:putative inorganic carbon (HCO3(-)) transporter